jgi:DNA-binding MarR family transcriptional regulator
VGSYGIVTRIGHIGHHLEGKRKRLLAALATDRGSMDILAMLRRAGRPYRQTAGQLTKSALITSGGVSQRLDKLERAGLVTRHIDVSDRRRVDVQLTSAGVGLVDAVLADLTAHDQLLLDKAMEPQEQEMLRSLLRKLLACLEPDGAS